MSKDYRDQTEIGLFLKNIFGLPLLNQEDVENCIIEDFISIMPKHEKLNEFMDYIIENYIDSGAKFPISMWAEMNSSSERTTNVCESFHSKYNSLFYTHHPDIYTFLEILKKIQIDTKIAIRTATQTTKKPKGSTCKKITYIEDNIKQFKNNKISRFDFVKRMAFKHQPI